MIDRIAVERLLQACEQGADVKIPAGPMLADLCRTWIALHDAPLAMVEASADYYAVMPTDGDSYIAISKLSGKRVRLVREVG